MITNGQRIALLLAAAAVVATVVMPPWKYVGYPVTIVAGYSWIWAPIGHSPCRLPPQPEDLAWVHERWPEHLDSFIRAFGCRPDQVDERPSDLAWHMLSMEWAAILLVAGLVFAGLRGSSPGMVSEAATTEVGNPDAPKGLDNGPTGSKDFRPTGGGESVARRLVTPMKVIARVAYPVGILIGWSATSMLLWTYVSPSYPAEIFLQLLTTLFFWVWLRHWYRESSNSTTEASQGDNMQAPTNDSSRTVEGSKPLMSGIAQRLGVPLRIVIAKMAYLVAILLGGLLTMGVLTYLLRTHGWKLGGLGYVGIAIGFGVLLRAVYRSEGGKIAALILSTGGLALALIVLAVSRLS